MRCHAPACGNIHAPRKTGRTAPRPVWGECAVSHPAHMHRMQAGYSKGGMRCKCTAQLRVNVLQRTQNVRSAPAANTHISSCKKEKELDPDHPCSIASLDATLLTGLCRRIFLQPQSVQPSAGPEHHVCRAPSSTAGTRQRDKIRAHVFPSRCRCGKATLRAAWQDIDPIACRLRDRTWDMQSCSACTQILVPGGHQVA